MTRRCSSNTAQVKAVVSVLLAGALARAATMGSAQPDLARANALYARANYERAIGVLESVPWDAHSLELLGQSYYMLGDFRKATDALEKAAAAAPDDSMIQTWLGRAWGMRAESAFALSAMGLAGKARDAFERAVRLDPANAEALGDLFDYYMEAPGIVGGGVDKAEALLPRYAQYDPLGFPIASARIAEKKQQYAAAEANFRKAVNAAPQRISLALELAQFLARRGRYDESEAAFRRAAGIWPDSPRILYARASSYIHTHRNADQARELLHGYLAASNLTPDDPPRWEAQKLLRKVEGS
jgi:tetratricopeptide (TPR) repeat protein